MTRFAPGVPTPLAAEVMKLAFRVGRCGERLRELIARNAPEEAIRLELSNLYRAADDLGITLFGVSAADVTEK